jgi:ABC-type polysaccharide transport system, permease component
MKDIFIRRTLADRHPNKVDQKRKLSPLWKNIVKYRWLYLMVLPDRKSFFIFQYLPLWNAQIAFKDFKPLLGVWKSPFTGFDHFITFFKSF